MEVNVTDVLSRERYLGLPVGEQERYIDKKLREILKDNQTGLTITDIISKTPFNRATVLKHLDSLVSCREAYKIKHGNVSVYYPNGKTVYPEGRIMAPIDDAKAFKGTLLQNNFGRFVFIELEGQEEVSGGSFLVRVEDLKIFAKFANRLASEVR